MWSDMELSEDIHVLNAPKLKCILIQPQIPTQSEWVGTLE